MLKPVTCHERVIRVLYRECAQRGFYGNWPLSASADRKRNPTHDEYRQVG